MTLLTEQFLSVLNYGNKTQLPSSPSPLCNLFMIKDFGFVIVTNAFKHNFHNSYPH